MILKSAFKKQINNDAQIFLNLLSGITLPSDLTDAFKLLKLAFLIDKLSLTVADLIV